MIKMNMLLNIFSGCQKIHRWNYIAQFSKQEEIGQILDGAFIEIENENEELKMSSENIFVSIYR